MKTLIILAIVLLNPITIFSDIGTNNFTIHVGGIFNTSALSGKNNHTLLPHNITFLGGGLSIELGHLYMDPKKNVFHVADTRLGFSTTGNASVTAKDTPMNNLTTYVGTTYSVGISGKKGWTLVDILGVNLGFFASFQEARLDGRINTTFSGSHFLLGITLPGGVQEIFDSGFIVGFRHRIEIPFSTIPRHFVTTGYEGSTFTKPTSGGIFGTHKSQQFLLSYALTLNLGYAFGR